jgi:uncharacterized repeat protein (TIGR03806 family)
MRPYSPTKGLLQGLSALFSVLLLAACSPDAGPETGFDLDSLPLNRLSDYGLFDGPLEGLEAGPFLLPYDLNTPLFTDYAEKARFVYIPPGSKARYESDFSLDFPEGTLLFKTFYYYHDERSPEQGRRILETRILARHQEGWKAYSYHWNDEQTDAVYRASGAVRAFSWVRADGSEQDLQYLIPNQVECRNCHEISGRLQPLGPRPRNLNKAYPYADGEANQLDRWASKGWVEGLPDPLAMGVLPVWDDPGSAGLEARARAYLEVNCGHCHRPDGDANNSGLFLHWENETDASLGICKPPVAAGGGSGGYRFSIVPGKPDSSILVFRMESNELDIRMPETGRSIEHREGVALVRAWIAAMPESDCP